MATWYVRPSGGTYGLENGTSYVILKNYFDEPELRDLFTPRFRIRQVVYKTYYWSVVLG